MQSTGQVMMAESQISNAEFEEERGPPETNMGPAQPNRPAMGLLKRQQAEHQEEGKVEEEGKEKKKEEAVGEEEEMEEEMVSSASLEPSTLQWPDDRRQKGDQNEYTTPHREEAYQGNGGEEERGGGTNMPNQALGKGQESWTESERDLGGRMSEVVKADVLEDEETERRSNEEIDGCQADSGGEEEENSVDEDTDLHWISEKRAPMFTPNVTIVQPTSRPEVQEDNPAHAGKLMEKIPLYKPQQQMTPTTEHYHPQWTNHGGMVTSEDGHRSCSCEVLQLALSVLAAAVIFPLLVWGGFALLPFDAPTLGSAPDRLMYTIRCAFFASLPIILGVLVHGVARLKFGALKPLYDGKWENREVAVHGLYVHDSLYLYILYFTQLAIMATYVRQDMLKLVPLLTIIFVFGRLIYWACVTFGSSVRGLGYGLCFLPVLVMLGVNLYFVVSSFGQDAVFDVAPPTTAPPPRPRWWG